MHRDTHTHTHTHTHAHTHTHTHTHTCKQTHTLAILICQKMLDKENADKHEFFPPLIGLKKGLKKTPKMTKCRLDQLYKRKIRQHASSEGWRFAFHLMLFFMNVIWEISVIFLKQLVLLSSKAPKYVLSPVIVEFLSRKIWQISDKTILLIACKGMHLLIRSCKTFIRSYTIKIPHIRSYTIKIPLIRSYTIKIPLIRSYTIKIPLIRSYTIKIPFIRSYTIKIPLIRSYTTKIPLIRSYTIKIPFIKIPEVW